MTIKLNLLPEDYALTGTAGQIVKFARPLNVIFLALFLIMVAGMGGFFIFSSLSLKNLTTQNNNLTSQIQAQSVAQQQIVLLKDRLGKIKTVRAIPTATDNLVKVDPLLALIMGNSILSELNIDTQKINATVIFKSNSDLTNFLRAVAASTNYSSVSLGTFNYNPVSGYQVGLSFIAK